MIPNKTKAKMPIYYDHFLQTWRWSVGPWLGVRGAYWGNGGGCPLEFVVLAYRKLLGNIREEARGDIPDISLEWRHSIVFDSVYCTLSELFFHDIIRETRNPLSSRYAVYIHSICWCYQYSVVGIFLHSTSKYPSPQSLLRSPVVSVWYIAPHASHIGTMRDAHPIRKLYIWLVPVRVAAA